MKTFRLLLGFIIGIFLFLLLIPYLLIDNAHVFPISSGINLISNIYLRLIIAIPVLGVGLLFALWSNVSLLLIGKGGPTDVFNFAISPRSQKLVISGPYRYCRNPMVFGMLSVYCSISLLFNSVSDLVIIILFIPLFIIYLKNTEEKRLLKDFGDDFKAYKLKVPMLIPFTKIRKTK